MELRQVAPSFVEMAHRIVWATTATVDRSGAPRTRILHPIWEWEGGRLTGWIATSPEWPKASDLAHEDRVSYLLGPDTRHLHSALRRRLGRLARTAARRLGTLRGGGTSGGL